MGYLKIVAWTSGIIAALLGYFGVIFELWLFIPALVIGVTSLVLFRRIKHLQALAELRQQWGTKSVLKPKRNFTIIRQFFDVIKQQSSAFTIDDRTWDDLDMDHIFAYIDRTLCVVGQQKLYHMLRVPVFDQTELAKRSKIIKLFQSDQNLRERIQLLLQWIEHDGGAEVANILWEPPKRSTDQYMWLYNLLFYCMIASPILMLISLEFGVLFVILLFIANAYIHSQVKKRISGNFTTLAGLRRLIIGAYRLVNVDIAELEEFNSELGATLDNLKGFLRISGGIGLESSDPIVGVVTEYISIFFLAEVRGYHRAIRMIKAKQSDFQKIFQLVGAIDAYQAIASYREYLAYYCEPNLSTDLENKTLSGEEMYHPLLESPQPNSIRINQKGILITGSNMSGKSTFLRAVGINALCAQTIYTCHAQKYETTFVKLLTAIGRSDNIIEGKSYYLVEAQSILRIIRELEAPQDTVILAIFDELYRGTNSEERIKAGCQVLKYVVKHHGLVLAATHDLELTEILTSYFENYHFREQIDENGLNFDYVLNEGPSTTRNAIALLKLLGYPEEITTEIN